jgi:hypothetical protein
MLSSMHFYDDDAGRQFLINVRINLPRLYDPSEGGSMFSKTLVHTYQTVRCQYPKYHNMSSTELTSRQRAPDPAYVTSIVHFPQLLPVVTVVACFKIFPLVT